MAVMPLKSLATKKTKSVPLLSEEVRLPEMMWRGHDVREEEEEEESRYSRMGGGEGWRGGGCYSHCSPNYTVGINV